MLGQSHLRCPCWVEGLGLLWKPAVAQQSQVLSSLTAGAQGYPGAGAWGCACPPPAPCSLNQLFNQLSTCCEARRAGGLPLTSAPQKGQVLKGDPETKWGRAAGQERAKCKLPSSPCPAALVPAWQDFRGFAIASEFVEMESKAVEEAGPAPAPQMPYFFSNGYLACWCLRLCQDSFYQF